MYSSHVWASWNGPAFLVKIASAHGGWVTSQRKISVSFMVGRSSVWRHPANVGDDLENHAVASEVAAHSVAPYSRASLECVLQNGRGSTPFSTSARMPVCTSQPPMT